MLECEDSVRTEKLERRKTRAQERGNEAPTNMLQFNRRISIKPGEKEEEEDTDIGEQDEM